jgi:hypothetical protein
LPGWPVEGCGCNGILERARGWGAGGGDGRADGASWQERLELVGALGSEEEDGAIGTHVETDAAGAGGLAELVAR